MFGSNCSVPLVASIDGNNNGNSMFGGDGWWAIIIFALIFGWGGNGFGGFGFGGFGGGNRGCAEPCATQADVRAAVDQQTLISKLDQQTYGLADASYALNSSITNGFHGVDNAICNLGYNVQSGFNGLSAQLAQCCCDNRAAIADVKYQMATDTCAVQNTVQNTARDIIDNANANNRALLDFLVKDKIETLQAENQSLRLTASQERQNNVLRAAMDANTAEIIRRTGNECPVPAYVVQPSTPVTFPTNCCGGVSYANFGYNNGGCGCGCN